MEHQGRLTQWNDARGFGFITPLSGGPRVFVHISAFQQRHRRPRLHDQLTHVIGVDDTNGSRHQRLILRLASGQTLLIAHNIDIAPRIAALKSGDPIAFYGQYEWNAEGGVIHWTHRDPNGQHVAGWLKHNGMIYQ